MSFIREKSEIWFYVHLMKLYLQQKKQQEIGVDRLSAIARTRVRTSYRNTVFTMIHPGKLQSIKLKYFMKGILCRLIFLRV